MPVTAKNSESVRRSARGQKPNPEAAQAESNLASESTTDVTMEDAPDSFELTVSPTKANNLQQQIERDQSFSGSFIHEQLSSKGVALKMVIDDWLATFEANAIGSVLQLVNTIIWSGTIHKDIELGLFEAEDEEPGQILSDFQESLDNNDIGANVLVGRKKTNQAFQRSFIEFWSKWAQTVFVNLPEASSISKKFVPWLIVLSTSKFRPLRQAAALSAFSILVGLGKASSDLATQLERASKVTKGSKSTGLGLTDELTSQIGCVEKTIQTLFTSIYIPRFRDVCKEIRKWSVELLVRFIQAQPGLFLDNHYLRYLGWALSDRVHEVRSTAIESLDKLYQDASNRTGLVAFTERFKPRIIEMASKDISEDVRKEAQTLVLRLLSSNFLDRASLSFINDVVKRQLPLGPEGCALLLVNIASDEKEEAGEFELFQAICTYIQDITDGMDLKKKLHIAEHVIALLSQPSTLPWLTDLAKCFEFASKMDEVVPLIIESCHRAALFKTPRSPRVVPSKPLNLADSASLTTIALPYWLEKTRDVEIGNVAALAFFETILLLDLNRSQQELENVLDAVNGLVGRIPYDSLVMTAAIQAFRFLANSDVLSDFVQINLKTQLNSAMNDKEFEKAALLLAVVPLPANSETEAILSDLSSNPTAGLLQFAYQVLLWRLLKAKTNEDQRDYASIVGLRDELIAACKFLDDDQVSTLIQLDLLHLFGPQQEWMSETWRYPSDHTIDKQLLDSLKFDSDEDIDKLVIGLARLTADGYEEATAILTAVAKWSGLTDHEDVISLSIEFMKENMSLLQLVTALPSVIIGHFSNCHQISSDSAEELTMNLTRALASYIRKSSHLMSVSENLVRATDLLIDHLCSLDDLKLQEAFAQLCNLLVPLLPPNANVSLEALKSKITKRSVHLVGYIKALEKHLKKGSRAKQLQLTPQKRKSSRSTGGSRLRLEIGDNDVDGEGESSSQVEGDLMDAFTDHVTESELASETNAFRQLAIANEESDSPHNDSPIPLRKKTVLRN